MFMGYIYLTCSECGRRVRHHTSDVAEWPTRICPGCGQKIVVSNPDEGAPQVD